MSAEPDEVRKARELLNSRRVREAQEIVRAYEEREHRTQFEKWGQAVHDSFERSERIQRERIENSDD
jgi:hypothetical protein